MKVRFISTNDDGNFYVGYLVDVQRGMGHQKVGELLIVGINKKYFKKWLKDHIDDMEFIGNE